MFHVMHDTDGHVSAHEDAHDAVLALGKFGHVDQHTELEAAFAKAGDRVYATDDDGADSGYYVIWAPLREAANKGKPEAAKASSAKRVRA